MENKIVRMRLGGCRIHEIASRMGIEVDTVREALRKRGMKATQIKQWNKREEDSLLLLRTMGHTFSEIGRRLGRSKSSVYKKWIKEMGSD